MHRRPGRDPAASAARYLDACDRLGWFSGAALLAREGEVVFRGALGMADRERRIPNGPSTRFRIGSLSKPLTARAVLRLEEQGRLDTGQPLSDFIPDYPGGAGIRIRHLLDHTSGIPDVVSLEEGGVVANRRYALSELVALCASRPPQFEPGTACRYSSSGYILLAQVIETASGTGYDRYLEDDVLAPLGMTSSGPWRATDGSPDSALGYTIDGSDVVPAAPRDPSTVVGCGGVASTVDDLFALDRALRREEHAGRGKRPAGAGSPGSGFVRGWRVSTAFQRRVVWHDGGIEGFAAGLYRFPDERSCVVLLSNLEHTCGKELCRTLAAILLGLTFSVPEVRRTVALPGATFAGLEGTYRFSPDFAVAVTRQGDRLFFRATRQPRFEILPASPDRFFLNASPAGLSFARRSGGAVSHLVLHQSGEHLVGRKVGPEPRLSS